MAKKKKKKKKQPTTMPATSGYVFVTARVEGSSLSWEYRAIDATMNGNMVHDEDVSGWSELDIRKLTGSMLDIPEQYIDLIEVVYL